MERKKAIKLGGFAGALCASAALVGISVSGTGAYFTDSHAGSINAGTGHVKVDTTDLSLNFNNLLPGEYQTKTVGYTARTSGAEDIWLVFPDHGNDAFSHIPVSGPIPLGRYGHFAVSSTNGASFTSYNLALSPNGGIGASDSCTIDANGEGGSTAQSATAADAAPPYCAPAGAILLASNLTEGQGGTASLEFGYTPLLKDPAAQGLATAPLVNFQIVATQHGIRPDNPNN